LISKVSTKVLAVVGVMAVTHGIVAVSFWNLAAIARDVSKYRQMVEADQMAKKLMASFADYRRHVREYAISGHLSELAAVQKYNKAFGKILHAAFDL
jgi:CHASE3 domain sensor protein